MNGDSLTLRITTAALALGCVLGLMHIVCVIGFHVPFDPNEGWNAIFTQAVLAKGTPYPPPQSLLINNYPPLSFYLVAPLASVTGDAIVAGRIVALAALFAVAVGIETAARQMGCTRVQAVFAALLFTTGLMLNTDYAGMDDPQLLGHAVAIVGLLLVLREPRTPRLMVGAAFVLTAAFFIKHNLVVLPVALSLWLLLADRRHAMTFMASGVVFLLIGLGLFRDTFGVSLLSQIDSARSYALANTESGLLQWLPWGAVSAAGAALLLTIARHDRHAVLCVLYAGVGIAAGTYFLSGAGVDANAMFDADIALALCAGLLINRLQFQIWQSVAAVVYAVPLAIGLGTLDVPWRDGDFWLHPMAEERNTASAQIGLVRAANGPVLCETLALCYWAEKSPQVDVFNVGQSYRTGTRADGDLVRAIEARRFALIEFEQLKPFALTAKIQQALMENYAIVRRDDDIVFLKPR